MLAVCLFYSLPAPRYSLPPMPVSPDNFPLLAELLADQQQLDTPVARFARAHTQAGTHAAPEVVARLAVPTPIPLSKPGPGEQYAFHVELDACSGCKSCVAACHSLNGLDETETWRDVGLILGGTRQSPFSQTITTACHHCEDPACLNGCPVLAYEKDPLTGIVRHLDDQCIGCSYCVLKCPYDVPKYSKRLGIVRKCDLCHGRLAHGEAPACVQACPTQAIRVVTVPIASLALPATSEPALGVAGSASETTPFLPTAPDPSYTRPTTRYVSRRGLPDNLIAGDATTLQPQPAHWPLVFLLVLMPLAVGLSALSALGSLATLLERPLPLDPRLPAWIGWVAGALGLGCSVLHLGQPTRAWRVFLGLRRSWLSREAVLFGVWFPLASTHLVVAQGWLPVPPPARAALAVATAFTGAFALFCSVMIYVDTRRRFWRFAQTAPRFYGTAVVLTVATVLPWLEQRAAVLAGVLLVIVLALKLVVESAVLATSDQDRIPHAAARTARLLTGPLRPVNELRLVLAGVGGAVIPLLVLTHAAPRALLFAGALAILGGEVAERLLFFRAVDAPKMPGVPG